MGLLSKLIKKTGEAISGPTPPAGADAQDPTGAGGATIGTGQVPMPQEQGFSGNEQASQPSAGQTTQQAQATGQQQGTVGQLQ